MKKNICVFSGTKLNCIVVQVFICFWAINVLFSGCERATYDCDNEPGGCPVSNWEQPELLPPNVLRYLDSIPSLEGFEPDSIKLPNGEFVTDYLEKNDSDFLRDWNNTNFKSDSFNINTFLARTTLIASKLTTESEFNFPNEGSNKPSQTKVAYVYGSNDFAVRRSAKSSNERNAVCREQLHGIDASGLIQYLFQKNNVTISQNPKDQINPNLMYESILHKFPTFKGRSVEESYYYSSNLKLGDIIFWQFSRNEDVALIGIIVKNKFGELGVLISYGSGYGACEKNYTKMRGPRILKLTDDLISGEFYFASDGSPISRDNVNKVYLLKANFSYIRISPIFVGYVEKSDRVNFEGQQNCSFELEMRDINLTFIDVDCFPLECSYMEMTATFNEVVTGCNRDIFPEGKQKFDYGSRFIGIPDYINVPVYAELDYYDTSDPGFPYVKADFSGKFSNGVLKGTLSFSPTYILGDLGYSFWYIAPTNITFKMY